jgi:hypothetical protein
MYFVDVAAENAQNLRQGDIVTSIPFFGNVGKTKCKAPYQGCEQTPVPKQ